MIVCTCTVIWLSLSGKGSSMLQVIFDLIQEVPYSAVEKEFWRLVSSIEDEVIIYSQIYLCFIH